MWRPASGATSRSLVWPWNCGFWMNTDKQRAGAAEQIVGGDLGDLPGTGQLAVGAQRPHQSAPQRLLVGAALRGRHRVAVEAGIRLLVQRPGDRPLDPAAAVAELGHADERQLGDRGAPGERRLEEVLEAGRKMEHLARRHVGARHQLRIALPADLDAAEQIRLAARQAMHRGRPELRALAEDLGVRPDPDRGAPAVRGRTEPLEAGGRRPAHVALAPQLAVAGDLDHQLLGERVDHGQADAVQPARGLIDLGPELAARMQRGQDHLERGAVGELRVRIDRDAAAVVAHRERAVRLEPDLDPAGVAGDRLVHGVVEELGRQMMQGALVGAADEHPRPPAHRLQALQDLDVGGGIVFGGGRALGALDKIVHGRVICRLP